VNVLALVRRAELAFGVSVLVAPALRAGLVAKAAVLAVDCVKPLARREDELLWRRRRAAHSLGSFERLAESQLLRVLRLAERLSRNGTLLLARGLGLEALSRLLDRLAGALLSIERLIPAAP